MPKGPNGEKRPADAIGLAVLVGRIATSEAEDVPADDGKDPAAKALGPRAARPARHVCHLNGGPKLQRQPRRSVGQNSSITNFFLRCIAPLHTQHMRVHWTRNMVDSGPQCQISSKHWKMRLPTWSLSWRVTRVTSSFRKLSGCGLCMLRNMARTMKGSLQRSRV